MSRNKLASSSRVPSLQLLIKRVLYFQIQKISSKRCGCPGFGHYFSARKKLCYRLDLMPYLFVKKGLEWGFELGTAISKKGKERLGRET